MTLVTMDDDKDSKRERVMKETTAGIEWKGRVDNVMRLVIGRRKHYVRGGGRALGNHAFGGKTRGKSRWRYQTCDKLCKCSVTC